LVGVVNDATIALHHHFTKFRGYEYGSLAISEEIKRLAAKTDFNTVIGPAIVAKYLLDRLRESPDNIQPTIDQRTRSLRFIVK